jgi:hypothetical protein
MAHQHYNYTRIRTLYNAIQLGGNNDFNFFFRFFFQRNTLYSKAIYGLSIEGHCARGAKQKS